MEWIKLSENNLPEANKLVWVKRSKGNMYLASRLDKPISTNTDASRDCYWYGKAVDEMLYTSIHFGEIKNCHNFSDVTVESWCELDIPSNN